MKGKEGDLVLWPAKFMTHERLGRILAGLSVLVSVALGFAHSPLWLLLTAATALNLFISGITDRCAVKNLLIRLGLPGERDVGRAEAIKSAPSSPGSAAAPVNRLTARERVAVN